MANKRKIYNLADPSLDNYNLLLNEVIFHNANGYIGIRYDFEEGYPEGYEITRSQYINGFYDYTEQYCKNNSGYICMSRAVYRDVVKNVLYNCSQNGSSIQKIKNMLRYASISRQIPQTQNVCIILPISISVIQ